MYQLIITSGEPAGIGPDVTIRAALELCREHNTSITNDAIQIHIVGDSGLLRQRATLLGCQHEWQKTITDKKITVVETPLSTPCIPGQLDSRHVPYVLNMLDTAIAACIHNPCAALVTAPVQKSIIAQTGVAFSGHTEYLAHKSHTKRVVMMLAGPQVLHPDRPILRVALATTHIPLAQVAQALSIEELLATLRIIDHDLRVRFRIAKPHILVAGLNPHAGEAGILGREEIDIIQPAITLARQQNINAHGPLPADTLFQPRYLEEADCVLAMYHDQGLAPLKYATFGHGVNITLGLPFIRTSVDHGTALALAGTGKAHHQSMLNALQMGLAILKAAE
jgi:4-hydroxythreonine-4-phosphate dehydrogenase